MGEGELIAYQVLDDGVAVFASGGEQVGTVDHVVAAPELDIFHGIVMRVGGDRRFVPAESVVELHEHGVNLALSAAETAGLPEPHGAAPVFRDDDPGSKPNRWEHFVNRLEGRPGRDGWKRES